MSNMFTLLLLFLAAAISFYVGLIVGRTSNADSELISKLERENVVLRADKKRLDWLMNKGDASAYRHMSAASILTRAAIDAARKEGKIRKKLLKTLVEEAQP